MENQTVSSHHQQRHCFTLIDWSHAPTVVVTDFTEGETYEYDFSAMPELLAAWMGTPTGHFFNAHVRNIGVPFKRISPPYKHR